jgi:hypothetical protein
MRDGSTLGRSGTPGNETVKGVIERAWEAERDAWETMIR